MQSIVKNLQTKKRNKNILHNNKIVGLEELYYWSPHINEIISKELLTSFESTGFKPNNIKIASNSQFIGLNSAWVTFGGRINGLLRKRVITVSLEVIY